MTFQSFSDQLGNRISIRYPPQRIISLVPSQTELLDFLGLDDRVIGVTRFCVHPSHWRSVKRVVGGTKKFDFSLIERLNPDLIVGNKEENYKEGIEKLSCDFPVWMSDIVTLEDAMSMIKSLGLVTGIQDRADECVKEICAKINGLRKYDGQSVLYMIWRKPWMAAGQNTFINTLLTAIGLKNVLQSTTRYPVLDVQEMATVTPEYIFLSSEPYNFTCAHADEIGRIFPSSKILFVDGEMFSWYGSRMIQAFDYFKTLEIG
jgi:ABC-type Fe3+-hydroxamate transport system substrate-binding protein